MSNMPLSHRDTLLSSSIEIPIRPGWVIDVMICENGFGFGHPNKTGAAIEIIVRGFLTGWRVAIFDEDGFYYDRLGLETTFRTEKESLAHSVLSLISEKDISYWANSDDEMSLNFWDEIIEETSNMLITTQVMRE